MNVVESVALCRRYRNCWALRNCTLRIPAGRVVALVGPNGAGKTTLLHLIVGLVAPTAGRLTVLGGEAAGSPEALGRVAFVPQDAPLYANLSVADTLHLARNLNSRWDHHLAMARLAALDIPLGKRVGKLSGGQQAQVALTLALARHPELLVLDEPVARLDPVARHDFMASLMTGVAEEGISVVLSSHVVTELERIADYLVVLSAGQPQLVGDVEELLGQHRMLTGPVAEAGRQSDRFRVVQRSQAKAQVHLLVRTTAPLEPVAQDWQSETVGLEELILAYLRAPTAISLPGPTLFEAGQAFEVMS